jgi:hypothetical protein
MLGGARAAENIVVIGRQIDTAVEPSLNVLDPGANRGYLPQGIPTARDDEISDLLSKVIVEQRIVQFTRNLKDGHGAVLRAFAERMTSAAVRNGDQGLLRKGLIALLLSSRSPDFRDTLMIFPLFYHAAGRLGLDLGPFLDSIRQTIGDPFSAPFAEFLKRPATNKSLQVMGYAEGADNDGFRYIRNW